MFHYGRRNRHRSCNRKQFMLTTRKREGGVLITECDDSDPMLLSGGHWRRRTLVLALHAGVALACSCSWVPKITPFSEVGIIVSYSGQHLSVSKRARRKSL